MTVEHKKSKGKANVMATTPGFHKNTNFIQYPRQIQEAIRSIGRNFYVTRSFNAERIGNSEYWGLVARPSDDFSIHLNTDREVLFVFSKYDTFEIRTLEAFDLFYDQLEQKRIDRGIRFLVSGDNRVEGVVQKYLQQNPEYPIIIPINYHNVREFNQEILESIRKNYLIRDLFGYQNPLQEETFFFGRQEQVNTVLDLAKSGQSSSMFGLRKSGKTSSIYAIMRKARSFGCIPVFIDCQSPAVHARRYNELLSLIVKEVREAIGQKRNIPELSGNEVEVAETFRSQLKTAISQAKSKLLIIFDEIENISPGTAASIHWETQRDCLLFWQNLRSFMQKDANGKLSTCIVGTSPKLLELEKLSDAPNPVYLFTQKRFISALDFEETRDMVDRLGFFMGLDFDPTQVAKLQELYGGHPFFTRQVCSLIHKGVGDNRPIKVSDRQMEKAITEFGGQLDTYLSDILSNLERFYPDEYRLLRDIAKGDLFEVSEYGRHAPDLIDHLIGYELVSRKGSDYDVRYKTIGEALRRRFRDKSTEDIWSECMLRRNSLENGLRRQLFYFSKGLSADEWGDLLERSMTRQRFAALSTNEARVLFSPKGSPLYWTDLMGLIGDSAVFPYLEARRLELLEAMKIVNFDGRKDSHAKEITQSDYRAVDEALSVLEEEFSDPA